MKTYQKFLIGFVLFLLLLVSAIHFYSSWYLEDQIQRTMVTEINSRSDGRYEFSLSDLQLSFLNRTLQLEGITFNTTEKAVQQLEVDIASVSLTNIDLSQLIFKREISIGNILIDEPTVQLRRDESESTGSSTGSMITRAAEASSTVLSNVNIPEISISGFNLQLYRQQDSEPYLSFSETDLTFFDVSLNRASFSGSFPFLQSEGVFRHLNYAPDSGLYALRSTSVNFSSINQTASADSLTLTPLLEADDFFNTVGFRTDRITGFTNRVELIGFDVNKFMNSGSLITNAIRIENPELSLFRNKNYPRRENRAEKPLPQELLHQIPFQVQADTVSIVNAGIRYAEIAEEATDSGFIEFTNLNARLLNTTNIDSLILQNNTWTLEASTRVMGSGELDVSFHFPLNEDYHTITGRLKEMDAMVLNNALEPIASVRIESGKISAMRFEMRLDRKGAIGFLEVIYDDLKISVLDGETGDKNLRSRITSLLANTLKIKKENRAENPRMGTIDYAREPEKSFFNYWWKSLRTGLKTSVGLDD
jgi:hypothetical protein